MTGGDLGRTAVAVEGLDLHQLGQRIELQDAALDVTIEQQCEDFAGCITVLGEQVLRLALGGFGTLAAGQQWRIPGQMAQQVKGCLLYTSPSPRD